MDVFGKKEIAALQQRNAELETLMTPELRDIDKARKLIGTLNEAISEQRAEIETRNETIKDLNAQITAKKAQIVTFDDEILVQEFGIYEPRYDFKDSLQYKDKLEVIRSEQKRAIKNGNAVIGSTTWTVNGDAATGRKMVNDTEKLLLRAFNSECDDVIRRVKYSNIGASINSIERSASIIGKLGATMSILVTGIYIELKRQEAYLAFEYQQTKEREKEEAREAREQMREEAKLAKEIEEARKKIDKEQKQYQKALRDIIDQLGVASPSEKTALLEKKAELEEQLGEIEISLKDIDYRATNQRAGYVYVISNIGSFGENRYKIGMTRRLDPMERISELGDASVPFNFDVHAMIFSNDAPSLENALHRAFEQNRMNMVNARREFFDVTLEEIESVVLANYDKTVDFAKVPDAEQYRVTQKMKELS